MSTEYLNVRVERWGQLCVLAVSGEMDACSSATFADGMAAAAESAARRVIVDLSGLRFIDCGAARILAAVVRPEPGRPPVVVRSVRPAVRRVLNLIAVDPDLLGPSPDLTGQGRPGGAAVAAGSTTGRLVRRVQAARSHAVQAIAGSLNAANELAATEDEIAFTFIELAARRPKAAERLLTLGHAARVQAGRLRDQAGQVR